MCSSISISIISPMVDRRSLKPNSQKSSSKVTINSYMMGSLFFVLTLVIALNPNNFSPVIITQLVLAIPLLYVSSLAYTKIGYWKEIRDWDILGWFTNTTGNLMVINAVGLLANEFSSDLAHLYFYLFCFLMLIYTFINLKHNRETWITKIGKLSYLLVVVTVGGLNHI